MKSRYHTGCRQALPTSLARNAGAAIPPTVLQRDISRTRFPGTVAAALALCCGSLMDRTGYFFRSSILCLELYHGKTVLSKLFLLRFHFLELCPRTPAVSAGKICKSDKRLTAIPTVHPSIPCTKANRIILCRIEPLLQDPLIRTGIKTGFDAHAIRARCKNAPSLRDQFANQCH